MRLSVIIPVLHEARTINTILSRLLRETAGRPADVIVVDGDPLGATLNAIRDPKVIRVRSPAGRGTQMNAGAQRASGDLLLFLHADTTLPPGGIRTLLETMGPSGRVGGAFDLDIASNRPALRLIARMGSLRSRVTRIPYGDQGIFIRRAAFQALGGFSDIPLMEDVDLMRRIKRRGWPILILPLRVRTSPRRWEREGIVYGTLRNWTLILLYLTGVSPDRLARYYRGPA